MEVEYESCREGGGLCGRDGGLGVVGMDGEVVSDLYSWRYWNVFDASNLEISFELFLFF